MDVSSLSLFDVAAVLILLIGLAAIPLALFARWFSVRVPLTLVRGRIDLGKLAAPTLVWGGLRGGTSIARALSFPHGPYRTPVVAATRDRDLLCNCSGRQYWRTDRQAQGMQPGL